MEDKKSIYVSFETAEKKLQELTTAYLNYYENEYDANLVKKKTKGASNVFYKRLAEDSKRIHKTEVKLISESWFRKYFDGTKETDRNFSPSSLVDLDTLIQFYTTENIFQDVSSQKMKNKRVKYLVPILLFIIIATGLWYLQYTNLKIEQASKYGFVKDPTGNGIGNVYFSNYPGTNYFDTISWKSKDSVIQFPLKIEFRNQGTRDLNWVTANIEYPKSGTDKKCIIIGKLIAGNQQSTRLIDSATITNLPSKWSLSIKDVIQTNDNSLCGDMYLYIGEKPIEHLERRKGLFLGHLSYREEAPEGKKTCFGGYLTVLFELSDLTNKSIQHSK